MIRLPRPWVAAATLLCWGAQAAWADGLRWSPPSYSQKVETSPAESQSNTLGWLLVAGGVALDVSSFLLADKADDHYHAYQNGTDPAELSSQYDDAVRYDRLASATLIVGQVAIGTGLYLLLIKHPKSSGDVGLSSGASEPRVAVGYRPSSPAGPGGLALTVRF